MEKGLFEFKVFAFLIQLASFIALTITFIIIPVA